jgi:hypothetical protein
LLKLVVVGRKEEIKDKEQRTCATATLESWCRGRERQVECEQKQPYIDDRTTRKESWKVGIRLGVRSKQELDCRRSR